MEINEIKKQAIDSIREQIKLELDNVEIGSEDNLIEKGLSSIMIMKISNKIRKIGIKISFAKLMENPTMGQWQKIIEESKIKSKKIEDKVIESKIKDPHGEFPLTDVQYAYWVGREDDQVLGGVGCHAYLEIDGDNVDEVKLKDGWNVLQKNHPMLRAKFTKHGTQKIMEEPYSTEIGIYNFKFKQQDEIDEKLKEIRQEVSHRKLKVEQGQVAGLSIALLPNNKSRIFLDVDLLVADVMSLSLIIDDLAQIYNGEYKYSYSDYTFKNYIEERNVDQKTFEEDKEFWKKKLENIPKESPNLPLKKKPEFIKNTMFVRRKEVIDKTSWSQIKKIAANYKITPSMVLLTCYSLVIERWTNQDKFMINMPLFNRDTENENLRHMIADFTNLLLVEYERKDNETILETIKRVSNIFLENVSHSSYSGIQVQRDIYREIGSNNNIAPIVFACNIDYALETEISKKAFGKISYMVSQTPQVWLDFQTYIVEEALVLCWDAVEELYPKDLLNDMFSSLVKLIKYLAHNDNWNTLYDVLPQKQKLMRDDELKNIIPLQYPSKTLYTDFIENVEKSPSAIAIIDGEIGKEITYKELYDQALIIASKLLSKGVSNGDYIGITLPRGYEQIVAIFGVLFAGAAYVPIGINQPKERRNIIYEQVGIKYVLSNLETIKDCSLDSEEIILVNIDETPLMEKYLHEPVKVNPCDSAYVIMTSGTTGVPKGVEICHENAINTILDINEKYGIDNKDTILMVSAIDFDLSVYDIFGLLAVGGKIISLNEDNYKNPDLWIELMKKYNVTIWDSVPILFDMLVTMSEGKNEALPIKVAMLSGDWIAVDLPSRFYNRSSNSIVVAMGGATEASIWSNYLNVPKEIPQDWVSIPYGKPLKNQVYRVVDDFGRICPDYVKGELIIGGVGVAKCYRGDNELTNRKFILKDGIRWYKTGDEGRTWSDGTIEFLGRKDNQVKIKGYRVELGEIEDAILKICPYTKVKVISNERKNAIYAFISGEQEKYKDLKAELARRLPNYMIPEKIIFIENMPLNKNNKVDTKILLSLINNDKDYSVHMKNSPGCSEIEEKILNIFKEYTNNKDYTVNSNFFECGGDSLVALNIMLKINSELKCDLNIGDIFDNPTIKLLAQNHKILNSNIQIKSLKEDEEKSYEGDKLTALQYSYWVSRIGYGNIVRQPSNFYIELECSNLDKFKLEQCVNKFIEKYPIFRAIVSEDGQRFKIRDQVSPYLITENNVSSNEEIIKQQELLKIRNEIMGSIEELNHINPMDVKITKIDEFKSIVHIRFDNMYFDAASIIHLLNELNLLYIGKDTSKVVLNRGEFTNHSKYKMDEDKLYWKRKLDNIHPYPLIQDSEMNNVSGIFNRLFFTLRKEYVDKLKALSQKHAITTSNIILSVFSEIIALWSNNDKYTINVILLDNKKSVHEFIGEIGDYTTNILSSIDYEKNHSFHHRTWNIQKRLFEDMEHMSYEGVSVLRDLRKRDSVLFEKMPVVYTNTTGHAMSVEVSGIGDISHIITQTPGVYLDCQVSIINGEFTVNWDYMKEVFDYNVIEKYFNLFKETLEKVILDESIWEKNLIIDHRACQCIAFEEGTI